MAKKSLLTDKPLNLIKKYRQALQNNGIPVEKIILFGSYAKGTEKYYSDLDLCVVSKIFGKDGYDDLVRVNKLTIGVDSLIEAHPYHPKDLEDRFDPLAHEIMTTGKVIV